MIKRGDPIVQVIPFKRTEAYAKSIVRNASFEEWQNKG